MREIQIAVIGDSQLADKMIARLSNRKCNIIHYGNNASESIEVNNVTDYISIANTCDLVVTIQQDIVDLEKILVGSNGVIHTRRSDSVVVDMSSVSPEFIKEVAEMFIEHERNFLDATYLDDKYKDILVVGGDKYVYENVSTILNLLADKVLHIGEHGASQFYRQAFAVRNKTDD